MFNSVKFLSFLLLTIVVGQAYAQKLTVTGVVSEAETGDPIPGAYIVIKGTTQGTVTNFDGAYTIKAVSSDTLVFTYVGMNAKEVAVGNQSQINVALEADTQQLEEVMVVAYGTTTKEAFTGSAETVDAKVIEARPVSSFDKALQGSVAGLQVSSSSGQPGAGTSIQIRGTGSFTGSQPLYVIDGVPVVSGGVSSVASSSNIMSSINPSDIASLTVLKDAAASSLYGSRAANGVVIITTKKGKQGDTKFTIDGQTGVSHRISDGYGLMNSAEYYKHTWDGLYYEALEGGDLQADAAQYAHNNVKNITGWNPYNVDQPFDDTGVLVDGAELIRDTDWRDAIYQTGLTHNYNFSAANANEATSFFLSGGYFNQEGIVIGSDFERFTGRFNIDHKVSDHFKIGMNNQLSYSSQNSPPSGSGGSNPTYTAEIMNPTTPVRIGDQYNWENTSFLDFNPVGLNEMDIYESITKRVFSNAYFEIDFLENFKWRTLGGLDYVDVDEVQYYNKYHGNGAGVNGRITQVRNSIMSLNLTNTLNWSKQMDKHFVDVLVGQEAYEQASNSMSGQVTNLSVPNNPHLVVGSVPESAFSSASAWSMLSFLSKFTYEYDGKYFFNASVRTDGSSRFGPENRWGKFYSAGGGWNMKSESFLEDVSWLNYMKLRGSIGTSGNNEIGNFAYMNLYGLGSKYASNPGMTPVQLANDEITWEFMTTYNVGIDMTIFENVSMSVEYYNRFSDGLLFATPLSLSKGFSSIQTNLGSMQNSGVELTLSTKNIQKKNFSWFTDFNITTNKNEIKSIEQDQLISGNTILKPGSDVGTNYMREWAGVNPDNGMPMWYVNHAYDQNSHEEMPASAYEDPLGTGKMVTSEYADANRIEAGSNLPKFYGGLTNTFSFKGFDASALLFFSYGNVRYHSAYASNMHDGTSAANNLATDALDAWTPENRYTDVPRYMNNNLDDGNQTSTRFLENGSFMRLKNVSIGYSLPENACKRMGISNLRVYAIGENLWTSTEFKGFDPETSSNVIPGAKTYSVGFNLGL